MSHTIVQEIQVSRKIQYNACFTIPGWFRGASREKIYLELGLESLEDRRLSRRLIFLYKIINGFAPSYLAENLPPQRGEDDVGAGRRRRPPFVPPFCRTERYRASFFPFCISEWNSLDASIRNLPSISSFKNAILKFFRPSANSVFNVMDNKGVVLLNRLRVGFSHLREHKFRHNFTDTVDPFCNCRNNSLETTEHFLMHCSDFSNDRLVMFNTLLQLDISLLPLNPRVLCKTLIYGDSNFSAEENHEILSTTIKFLNNTGRFSGALF